MAPVLPEESEREEDPRKDDTVISEATSSLYLKTLFEKSNDAMLTVFRDEIVECNQSACTMFRMVRKDLIGSRPWELSPPRQPDGSLSRDKSMKHIDRALRGEAEVFDWRHSRGDGTEFYAEVSLTGIRIGDVDYFHAMVRDVTARREAEEETRRRLEMEGLVARISARLLSCSTEEMEAEIDEALRAMGSMTGAGRAFLFRYQGGGDVMSLANEWCPGDAPSRIDQLRDLSCDDFPWWTAAIRGGEVLEIKGRHGIPEDARGEVEILVNEEFGSVVAIPMARGDSMVGFLGFELAGERAWTPSDIAILKTLANLFINAWERVRGRKRIDERDEQLRHAQKMELIGRLTGSVAHDFNNLLVPILTNAQFLVDDLPDDSDSKEDAIEIAEAARRAAALTKQLLAASRKQLMKTELVDLDDMVESSQKLLSRLVRANIEWETKHGDVEFKINADISQLQQVLMNLVVNAADAMPDGGVLTVSTGVVSLDEEEADGMPDAHEGTFAVLSVRDTGMGIDPEITDKIFEPFFTTKEKGQGTGLGLATVYGIVRQHGGFLSVISEPGEGSDFRVYLPAGSDDLPRRRSSVGAARHFGALRVLVVEDDTNVRKAMKTILRRHGHIVEEAADAETAMDQLRTGTQRPDLLLTDIVLPGMSGHDLYREFADVFPDTRVLFTSGYPGEGESIIENLGEHVFIAKPFTSDQLLKAIMEAMTRTLE